MRRVPVSRVYLFLAIAATGCLVDLATKHWIFNRLGMPGGETWWLWRPFFGLQTSVNEGALFGVGQGQVWLFAIASGAAILGIGWWLFFVGAARDLSLTLARQSSWGGCSAT